MSTSIRMLNRFHLNIGVFSLYESYLYGVQLWEKGRLTTDSLISPVQTTTLKICILKYIRACISWPWHFKYHLKKDWLGIFRFLALHVSLANSTWNKACLFKHSFTLLVRLFLLIIWKLTDMHHWALSKNSVFYAESKWKKSSRKVAQLLTVHSRHLWIVEFLCLMCPVFSHIRENLALLQRDQTNLIHLWVFLFVFENKYPNSFHNKFLKHKQSISIYAKYC